jgi:hypothetical protein
LLTVHACACVQEELEGEVTKLNKAIASTVCARVSVMLCLILCDAECTWREMEANGNESVRVCV